MLDPHRLPLALIGRGEPLLRRLAWLRDGGADRLLVFTDEPSPTLERELGPRLITRWPTGVELMAARVLWLTGLPAVIADPLADAARRAGALVNVEDVMDACDFHSPALVRRGDLLLTVSTGGRSPGLAARVRAWLDDQFGPDWAQRLDLLATKRTAWRRRPRSLEELAHLTDAAIDHRGWLGEGAPR